MARRRDWTDPWTNPLGEILVTIIGKLPLRRDDREAGWELEDHHQPEPAWSGLRFCKTCNAGTLHQEYWWRVEDETTIECTKCGAVYVHG